MFVHKDGKPAKEWTEEEWAIFAEFTHDLGTKMGNDLFGGKELMWKDLPESRKKSSIEWAKTLRISQEESAEFWKPVPITVPLGSPNEE